MPAASSFLRTVTLSLALGAAGAAPAAAQCWSGGAPGNGVPRESLLIVNRSPFAVNVMAGPIDGSRRVLGQVAANSQMRFLGVLPPGRNQTTVWVDPEESEKHKLAAARVNGTITIANRGALTCRRTAQLTVTPAVFMARRTNTNSTVARNRTRNPGDLAPGAGPNRRAATPPTQGAARTPGPPGGAPGVVRY
jgi:hypothetical protein